MNIDPRRLGVLLAVARHNSVVAAAEDLMVSPSAVSQQIARLEAETRITVLERHPTGVSLTPAGRVLAEAAEAIESELGRARQELLEMGGAVTGTVRVGGFGSVIRAILVPLLVELDERLPGVDLVVHEVTPEDAEPALRSGDLDLVVQERDATIRSTIPRGLGEVPLLDEPWYLITPANLPEPRTLVETAHRPWLDLAATTAAGRAMRRVTAGLGVERAPHRAVDHAAALALVAAGLGTTVLPWLAVRGNVPDGVAALRLAGLGSRRLVIRHRTTRGEPTKAARAVVGAMVDVATALRDESEGV